MLKQAIKIRHSLFQLLSVRLAERKEGSQFDCTEFGVCFRYVSGFGMSMVKI